MSDWEIVQDNNSNPAQGSPQSDWEVVNTTLSQQPQQESLGTAAAKAPFRIGEDVARGAYNFVKDIPKYYEAAKTEVPGAISLLATNPRHAASQGAAGVAELGQNIFNLPHDAVNYATNRLNLIPQSVNQKVQMGRMPDSSEQINQTFGRPDEQGENLIRGLGRNVLNLIAGGKAANVLNPANLTAKSIAKDVLNTEKKQIGIHSKAYNQIWNEAEKTGFNAVPVDSNILNRNLDVISKYKTPKEYESLNKLINDPTLENAQRAQSDMGHISRGLEDRSRRGSLTSEEKAVYDAAQQTEKHIQENMFKDKSGQTNEMLQKKYGDVTKSYRENVVPYKYNPQIQAYKNKELLAKELVNSLSRGEFAAKKGGAHPAIGIRNALADHPYLSGAGLGTLGTVLYNEMMGNKTPE